MIGHGSGAKATAVGLALTAGMLLATACGSSSDDAGSDAQTPAATTASAVEPKTTTSKTARPEDAEETAIFNEQTKAGTVRLAALAIGKPGGDVVATPSGYVNDKFKFNHFYKPGTKVTLRARKTGDLKFVGWSGACQGKSRTCKLTVDDTVRVLAGFIPKE